jgi:hypothetical protein
MWIMYCVSVNKTYRVTLRVPEDIRAQWDAFEDEHSSLGLSQGQMAIALIRRGLVALEVASHSTMPKTEWKRRYGGTKI